MKERVNKYLADEDLIYSGDASIVHTVNLLHDIVGVDKIKKLVKKGIIICGASQTIYGGLNPNVYSAGRELQKTGIIFLEDMLAETALIKLGYVLAKTKDKNEIKKMMLTNIVGELNKKLQI